MEQKEELARFLLDHDYALTALELHHELLDEGTELAVLKEFFSDDNNFKALDAVLDDASHRAYAGGRRTSLSSAGAGSTSVVPSAGRSDGGERDSREKEERIALLEYELRLAREDVKALRQRNTALARLEQDSLMTLIEGDRGADAATCTAASSVTTPTLAGAGEPSRPVPGPTATLTPSTSDHVLVAPVGTVERRMLLHVTQQMLLRENLLQTAITLADEAGEAVLREGEQHWVDIGYQEAPPVHVLLRTWRQSTPEAAAAAEAAVVAAKAAAVEAEERAVALQREVSMLQEQRSVAAERMSKLETQVRELKNTSAAEGVAEESPPAETGGDETDADPEQASVEAGDDDAPAHSGNETNQGSDAGDAVAVASSDGDAGAGACSTTDAAGAAVAAASDAPGDTAAAAPRVTRLDVPDAGSASRSGSPLARAGSPRRGVSASPESEEVALLDTVAQALPKIVPNVLLPKRNTVIPVILLVIRRHPDAETRERLTHVLFNLIKRPDEVQRRFIMDGCVDLAQAIGPVRVEEELLPLCWEQLSHRFPERRVLVALSCGELARFVRPELRASLLLSILQQLLDDRSPLVREAVASNMGTLVASFSAVVASDDEQKFRQVLELALALVYDRDSEVVKAAVSRLVSALLDWAQLSGTFVYTSMLPTLVRRLEREVQAHASDLGASVAQVSSWDAAAQHSLGLLMQSIEMTVPKLHETVLYSAPFAPQVLGRDPHGSAAAAAAASPAVASSTARLVKEREALHARFSQYMDGEEEDGEAGAATNGASWPAMDWLAVELVPQLLRLSSVSHPFDRIARQCLTRLWSRLCTCFGDGFTRNLVKLQFFTTFDRPDAQPVAFVPMTSEASVGDDTGDGDGDACEAGDKLLDTVRARLLSIFLAGVLASMTTGDDLRGFLRSLVISIAQSDGGWSRSYQPVLENALCDLCRSGSPVVSEAVLAELWELVVHPVASVRVAVADDFHALSALLPPDDVQQRIVPALVTMATDPEPGVRVATTHAVGAVMMHVPDRGLIEKLAMQLEQLFNDASTDVTLAILEVFREVIPESSPALLHLRDSTILPSLLELAGELGDPASTKRQLAESVRIELSDALIDCYAAFGGSLLSQAVIDEYIVPALRGLLNDGVAKSAECRNVAQSMLTVMEKRSSAGARSTAAAAAAAAAASSSSSVDSHPATSSGDTFFDKTIAMFGKKPVPGPAQQPR